MTVIYTSESPFLKTLVYSSRSSGLIVSVLQPPGWRWLPGQFFNLTIGMDPPDESLVETASRARAAGWDSTAAQ
jgi:hypothetical protein